MSTLRKTLIADNDRLRAEVERLVDIIAVRNDENGRLRAEIEQLTGRLSEAEKVTEVLRTARLSEAKRVDEILLAARDILRGGLQQMPKAIGEPNWGEGQGQSFGIIGRKQAPEEK